MQLSGVGPSDLLRSHGIDVIADMPGVGSDLQDHLQVRMQFRSSQPITANDVINNWRHRYTAGIRYMLTRKGLLGVGAGYGGAFFKTRPDLATPDVQIHFLIFSTEIRWRHCASVFGLHGIGVPVASRQPRLCPDQVCRSRDAAGDPAALSHGTQRRRHHHRRAETTRQVMNQPVMRKLIAEERAPGEKIVSDADLLEYARNTGTTVYHPTSTCRMGPDANAVVDERLRVRGFERLRVIDASVMPTLVSGNTNAAAVMIGEKGSDMVLQDAAVSVPVAMSA